MYYDFFTIRTYIYYTKNTGGLQCCLGQVISRESFQANPKCFKTILSPHAIFGILCSTMSSMDEPMQRPHKMMVSPFEETPGETVLGEN